jgi:hypothetical protein
LLQAGEHVADAIYFQGNDSPNAVGPFDPALPDGCDFDACNAEVLDRLCVRDGDVVLPDGKSYRFLVLPKHGRITLASLRRIAALGRDGARLIGTPPRESPSLADADASDEYARLAGGIGPAPAFMDVMPDFAFNDASGLILHAIHRRAGDADIYFVASASRQSGFADCRFRITGRIPELWDAATGRTRAADAWRIENGVTTVPLQFDPSGSIFVVFRRPATTPQAAGRNWTETHPLQPIQGPWTLQFPAGLGAPDEIVLSNLVSWSEHADEGVRHFSGTAIYRREFDVPSPVNRQSPILLDLGRVEVIAEVRLNGQLLGTLWKPPFCCDATPALREGGNELEIRVTNLWPNRLIGDELFPDDMATWGKWPGGGIRAWPDWLLKNQARPEPRRQTFFTWKHWSRDDALLPSGLFGPVTLRAERPVDVQ